MQTELELKAFLLTAAHVGLLHAPDVRTTLVTRLHDVDLVVDKTVVQGALDLTGDFLGLDITIFFEKQKEMQSKGETFPFWELTLLSFDLLFFLALAGWKTDIV